MKGCHVSGAVPYPWHRPWNRAKLWLIISQQTNFRPIHLISLYKLSIKLHSWIFWLLQIFKNFSSTLKISASSVRLMLTLNWAWSDPEEGWILVTSVISLTTIWPVRRKNACNPRCQKICKNCSWFWSICSGEVRTWLNAALTGVFGRQLVPRTKNKSKAKNSWDWECPRVGAHLEFRKQAKVIGNLFGVMLAPYPWFSVIFLWHPETQFQQLTR